MTGGLRGLRTFNRIVIYFWKNYGALLWDLNHEGVRNCSLPAAWVLYAWAAFAFIGTGQT
jgi:hypothetical protein